eukprot:scaffold2197_cov76-Skeletonema_dohrnii-CCMP3373.AAC.2
MAARESPGMMQRKKVVEIGFGLNTKIANFKFFKTSTSQTLPHRTSHTCVNHSQNTSGDYKNDTDCPLIRIQRTVLVSSFSFTRVQRSLAFKMEENDR